MDITITPDTYTPSVDTNGQYIDSIPIIKHGIYCSCGSRKDKIYENASKFVIHIKSKMHQKWIENLNHNKANYYIELLKTLTIDYLTEQLTNKTKPIVIDLLDM